MEKTIFFALESKVILNHGLLGVINIIALLGKSFLQYR